MHERRRAAAQHGLLAEQVGLGLLGERRAQHAGLRPADALGVRQRERQRRPDGSCSTATRHGHPAPVDELPADEVARALRARPSRRRRRRRGDQAEADVQAVPEEQRVAVLEVRRDVVLVELPLHGVRRQDHDDVGLGGGLGRRDDPQALLLGPGRLLLPSGSPTRTSTPESRSDSACACPWLP
jgi:hypothetical protein